MDLDLDTMPGSLTLDQQAELISLRARLSTMSKGQVTALLNELLEKQIHQNNRIVAQLKA